MKLYCAPPVKQDADELAKYHYVLLVDGNGDHDSLGDLPYDIEDHLIKKVRNQGNDGLNGNDVHGSADLHRSITM